MKSRLIALMLACGTVASAVHASVYVTDENGDSIGSSHYSITYVGGNAWDVTIKTHHEGAQGTS